MLLNEPVKISKARCAIFGAPKEEITLTDFLSEWTLTIQLNEKGETYLKDPLSFGAYTITGTRSKEALPEGRSVFFSYQTETVEYEGKEYKIITTYPPNTWFWFGRTFGEWKGYHNMIPASPPFSNDDHCQYIEADDPTKLTNSFNEETGQLKIYSESSKKNIVHAWAANILLPYSPQGECRRAVFLAQAKKNGNKVKEAYIGLGINSQEGEETNPELLDKYNLRLMSEIGEKKDLYQVDVTRYPNDAFTPVAFVANDSNKDGTLKSTEIIIDAMWMDHLEAASGMTEVLYKKAYTHGLRSDVCLMAGPGWHSATVVTGNYQNYFGQSSSEGAEGGVYSNSSMAMPLKWDFQGNSKKLYVRAYIYTPWAPWWCWWAISTNLEPYRAKNKNQKVNGNFPQVLNDDKQLAGGELYLEHGGYEWVDLEFDCPGAPKNETFYLIFYTKNGQRKGAAHATGIWEFQLEVGVDR